MPHLPRPLTQRERSVLTTLLSVVDDVAILQRAHDLLVVEECACGCPTVYFIDEDVRHWPVAEAYTTIERVRT